MRKDLNQAEVIRRCRAGDQQAAADLHSLYVQRLVRVAQQRLSGKLRSRLDAEDIVQTAFGSFFGRLREGHYDIRGSADLWNLLLRITLNMTFKQIDFHGRLRRDLRKEIAVCRLDGKQLLKILANEPSPEQTAQFLDELDYFLRQLGPEERQIVELRFKGHTNIEIARKLRISDRKIRRFYQRMHGRADLDS
jgi:RNA polymerase sigma-70 factor (ECF subfamily)